jgi:hypothetical protein
MLFRRWRDLDNHIVRCAAFSYRGRVVLVALLSFANESGLCWPSLPRLAREGGLSLATTKRALVELLEAGIVTRTARSVFQIDVGRLMSVLAEPNRLTSEPSDRLTGELSIGSPVSRGDPTHPFLNFKKRTHSVGAEPIASEECVCAVDDLGGRVAFVASAFALPRDAADEPIVPARMEAAIVKALRSYTPAVLHRAVEMARAQPWRKAELGAWCFGDESFLALVRKAQDEARRRTRTRPRIEKEPTREPESTEISAARAREVLRSLGVKRAG